MFATSTKTATFLPTLTPWDLVLGPAGADSLHGRDVHDGRRAAEPAAATALWIRWLDAPKPIRDQRARASSSSGRSASTTAQPLFLADRSNSSSKTSVMRSESYSGSTTRRSIVPT